MNWTWQRCEVSCPCGVATSGWMLLGGRQEWSRAAQGLWWAVWWNGVVEDVGVSHVEPSRKEWRREKEERCRRNSMGTRVDEDATYLGLY